MPISSEKTSLPLNFQISLSKTEVYYSPSLKKTFVGDLPKGYEGEFGPGVKAYILSSHYESKFTFIALGNTLQTHGIFISACTISRMLTDHKEAYHQEKKEIVKEGMGLQSPKQMDDTGASVKGKNHYAHILCNSEFTAYFTRPHKDRLTLLEILTMGPLTFKVNDMAYSLMSQFKLSVKSLKALKEQHIEEPLNRERMEGLLETLFPNPNKHTKSRKIILEASAIASYQALPHALQIMIWTGAFAKPELSGCYR